MFLIVVLNELRVVFSFRVHLIFLVVELELSYDKILLYNAIQIRIKTRTWHLLGNQAFQWRHIGRNIEVHSFEDLIPCTDERFDETWLKSSLTICYYEKVQQLAGTCENR